MMEFAVFGKVFNNFLSLSPLVTLQQVSNCMDDQILRCFKEGIVPDDPMDFIPRFLWKGDS